MNKKAIVFIVIVVILSLFYTLYRDNDSNWSELPPNTIVTNIPNKSDIKNINKWHYYNHKVSYRYLIDNITKEKEFLPVADVYIIATENNDGTVSFVMDATKSTPSNGKFYWTINGVIDNSEALRIERTLPIDDYEITFTISDKTKEQYTTGATVLFLINAGTAIK